MSWTREGIIRKGRSQHSMLHLVTYWVVVACSLLTLVCDSVLMAEDASQRKKTSIEIPEDIKTIPAVDISIEDDPKQRYFLIGNTEKPIPRNEGRRLLVVLPGGSGDAAFSPFIRRIYKHVLNDQWVVAQVVAPVWSEQQAEKIVWPIKALTTADVKITTEELFDRVVKDVSERTVIDDYQVYAMGWSSSGPAVYAIAAGRDKPLAGAFIAMSVFKTDHLPEFQNRQTPFFLLQSPDDRVTPFRFAESAREFLSEHEVKVKLQKYAGGHGWRGNIYESLTSGIDWLTESSGPED